MPPTAARRTRPAVEDAALPLSLPIPPALPGRVLPEFSVPCVGAFDDPDFRFSIDWDGTRTLLFASPGVIRLQSETLADVSDRYPEIVAAAQPLANRAAVLDGVVAVLDPSGCPDLVALGERMALGATTQQRLPAVYLAIDLLHLDGRGTIGLALDRRLELLRGLALPDPGSRCRTGSWVRGRPSRTPPPPVTCPRSSPAEGAPTITPEWPRRTASASPCGTGPTVS